MARIRLTPSTMNYAKEFKYWKETANTFFDIAEKQINDAIENVEDDTTAVELVAAAWHKCISAQWTLLKSGKQTANRMALRRGVDNRQFHPAQLKKGKVRPTAEEEVNRALEGK